MSYLDKIMCPHSLAVIGASNKEHTIGSDIMKRLVEYGFTGKIFPINPKDSEIQGMKATPPSGSPGRDRYGGDRY